MISLLAFLSLASAQTPSCEKIGLPDLLQIEAPAVLVLGERKGMWPDLLRAERLVARLNTRDAVTLALEAVSPDKQPVLDAFEAGEGRLSELPELLEWGASWGHAWSSYQGLFQYGQSGVEFVGIGHPPSLRPAEVPIPLPPGYLYVLLDAMGEHALPVDLEPRFVQTVAWRDYQLAKTAIEQWSGEGYLLILADRLHVEGSLGIGFQAQRMTDAAVHNVLLANAQTPCYAGDMVWRDHPLDR